MFYVKKTNAAWLRRRLDQLKERIKQLSEAKRENLISELDFIYDGIERRIAGTGFEERRQIIHSILPQFERERVRCETRDCRMDVTRTCLVRWKTVGNRRGLIERLMQEVDDRRMASRISMLAEMALMDLHFAAAGLAPNLPGWIQRLERCADNDRLPNEGMVNRKGMVTAVEVQLPEMEAPAPDPHAPTPAQSAAAPANEPPLLPPGPAVS
jgi:hypothetical protein